MPTKKTAPAKKKVAVKKSPANERRTTKSTKLPIQPRVLVNKTRVRSSGYEFAVGRRKTAVARVRRMPGEANLMTVNGLPLEQYFVPSDLQVIVRSPIELVAKDAAFQYSVRVRGGGSHSQAEAIRHGIARVLLKTDESWRPLLKQAGWLRRDARVKERKKPGLHRARRAPQWQKR
jgi:small subunit ribosomal protein S9